LSISSDYYFARADENRCAAEGPTLDNVRDRCRRSEAAWREMAGRVERGEVMRDTLAVEKAGRMGVAA
jgi:hypothetical protein